MREGSKTTSSRKVKIITAILVAVAIIVAFIGGYFSKYLIDSRSVNVTSDIVRLMEQVGYVYDPLTNERKEITEKDIADAITNALLDEYAVYYTPEEYEYVMAQSNGDYRDVGVGFYKNDSGSIDLVIDVVTGNSPAERAGLKEGDKLLSGRKDNGDEVLFADFTDFSTFISSCSMGEEIMLSVERNGNIVKDLIVKIESYKASYVCYRDSETGFNFRYDNGTWNLVEVADERLTTLSNDVGYIKFNSFESNAATQLKTAIEKMVLRGRTKLILDLRNNGGGYMNVLCDIASTLIYNQGKSRFVVAYAESKNGYEEFKTLVNKYDLAVKEIAVLANENSASASECLIGAMIHYGGNFGIENLVIEIGKSGEARTYGKGIMQTTYQLVGGGAFKLTTAKVLWPDKQTCIHGKVNGGIRPIEENAVLPSEALLRANAVLQD